MKDSDIQRWEGDPKKIVAENCMAISTEYLKKEVFLCRDVFCRDVCGGFYWFGHETSVGFIIRYEKREDGLFPPGPMMCLLIGSIEEVFFQEISLQATTPHFGGTRWWFSCPLLKKGVECAKRVGKLYLPPGAKSFGCRHCYDLSYRKRQEHNKRIAKMSVSDMALILSDLDSLPPEEGVIWAIFALKGLGYGRWHSDCAEQGIGEPDETVVVEGFLEKCRDTGYPKCWAKSFFTALERAFEAQFGYLPEEALSSDV